MKYTMALSGCVKKLSTASTLALALVAGLQSNRAIADTIDPAKLLNVNNWSVEYAIYEDQQPFPPDVQNDSPRDNRGLATSKTGEFVYLGYNTSFVGNSTSQQYPGEVRQLDTSIPGVGEANRTPYHVTGAGSSQPRRGKGLATDDQGRVYLAELNKVWVYDSTLTTLIQEITIPDAGVEGVVVNRDSGGNLQMFTTSRTNGNLRKFDLSESGINVTATQSTTFNSGTGFLNLGNELRGVDVDADGNIFVTRNASGTANDFIYKVSGAGSLLGSQALANPMDVAISANSVVVTLFDAKGLALLAADTFTVVNGMITVDLSALGVHDEPTSSAAGFSGIDFAHGSKLGFYIAYEGSAGIDDPFDPFDDFNDAVLFVNLNVVPEPAAFVLGGFALVGFLGYSRRQHKNRRAVEA